jgi:hypothetical protein
VLRNQAVVAEHTSSKRKRVDRCPANRSPELYAVVARRSSPKRKRVDRRLAIRSPKPSLALPEPALALFGVALFGVPKGQPRTRPA